MVTETLNAVMQAASLFTNSEQTKEMRALSIQEKTCVHSNMKYTS